MQTATYKKLNNFQVCNLFGINLARVSYETAVVPSYRVSLDAYRLHTREEWEGPTTAYKATTA